MTARFVVAQPVILVGYIFAVFAKEFLKLGCVIAGYDTSDIQ